MPIGQSQRDKETGEPDEATSFKSGSEGGWGKRPVMDLARSLPSDHEDPETGEAEKRFVLRQYTVFNAAQLDGVAIPEITVLAHRFTPIERCAQLLDAMPQRPAILHGHQRAFYTPATDTLHLPSPACFQSPAAYYATVWHEVTHATGHPSRLNRATLTDLCLFGDPTYAKEELVAELGAAYLCGVCGIANATLDNSAAYLQSWMQVLRQDPTMLVHAAAQAQRAADYIQHLHSDTGTVREGDDGTHTRAAPTP